MNENRTPILIACGQVIDRNLDSANRPPSHLIEQACRQAQLDLGSNQLFSKIDTIASCGLTVDAAQVSTPLSGSYRNLPKTIANLLGIRPKHFYYAETGGNTPQMLVNYFAAQIATGQAETVLLTGGEAIANMRKRFDHWYKILWPKGSWADRPGGKPISIGDKRREVNSHEALYDLQVAANTYPLFENALCAHYQRTNTDHLRSIGKLFQRFTEVAATNPYAWFQQARTAEELTTESESNRMTAYPYTKLLNSMIYVNQASAVILTTVAKAKAMGVNQDKWIFLHGCADLQEIWHLSERRDYHSSPALKETARAALDMAGKTVDDIGFFDIYSCFPSAVQIALDELGISHDDSRPLTQTGGLPYFGGPGNSYSLHAIAQMMLTLRENPEDFGMVNANGWFLTKHSFGIYSNQRLGQNWCKPELSGIQARLKSAARPAFTENPQGHATIETYTVYYDRQNNAQRGFVIGRLTDHTRFLAEIENDQDSLKQLIEHQAIGLSGTVRQSAKKNTFVLD